jgi:hypothetical protein
MQYIIYFIIVFFPDMASVSAIWALSPRRVHDHWPASVLGLLAVESVVIVEVIVGYAS